MTKHLLTPHVWVTFHMITKWENLEMQPHLNRSDGQRFSHDVANNLLIIPFIQFKAGMSKGDRRSDSSYTAELLHWR